MNTASPVTVAGETRATLDLAVLWIAQHTTQFAVAAIYAAAIVGLLYGLQLLGQWLSRGRENASHWYGILGKALRKTRFWFMLAVAAKIVTVGASAPAPIADIFHVLFVIAATLQAAIWVRALILGLIERRAVEADPNGSLQSAVGLIRVLLTAGLFLLALILILSNLGIDVTGLLAGLGIGGIAIGLAAQGIFSDLFAALSILFDRPFRKGDMIRWDQSGGTVEAIGVKSSRIRAMTGKRSSFPTPIC